MQKTFMFAGTLAMLVSVLCIALAVFWLLTGRLTLATPAFWGLVACHALTGLAAMSFLARARAPKGGST